MAKGTEHPCPGCGRVVAYALRVQYGIGLDGRGGGKGRKPHKCPHGLACVFGNRTHGHGFNWPTCQKCMIERRKEYRGRTQRAEVGHA